jgi:YrhK-like protein
VLTSFTSSRDLPAPRPIGEAPPAPAVPRPIEREREQRRHDHSGGWLGPLAARLDGRRRLLAASNILAAALFVVGCVTFYWPTLAAGSVTLFLLGSVLFLVSALGSAVLDHHLGQRR